MTRMPAAKPMFSVSMLSSAAAGVLIVAMSALAQAQQLDRQASVTDHFNLDFYGSLDYSDNVLLSETDRQGQWILKPRVDIDYVKPGRNLESNISGRLEGREYLGGAYNTDLIGGLDGSVIWHAVPGRLDWVFEDHLTTAGNTPIANSTPDSVQLVNVAVTGPTFRARFQPRLNGQLDVRYARSDAQTTREFAADRLSALGHLNYLLTPTSNAGLNLSVQQARYDEASVTADFDRRDATIAFDRRGPKNAMSIEAGYVWLDFRSTGGNFAGSLLHATAQHAFTPRASVVLDIARQYTDAARSLQLDTPQVRPVITDNGPAGIAITADVYREARVDLSFRYLGDTWSVRAAPFVREIRYLHPNEFAINRDSRGLVIDGNCRLSPLWMVSADLRLDSSEYKSPDARDKHRLLSAFLLHQFAPRWAWRFELSHQRRDSDIPGFTYRENVIGASLIYRRFENILK